MLKSTRHGTDTHTHTDIENKEYACMEKCEPIQLVRTFIKRPTSFTATKRREEWNKLFSIKKSVVCVCLIWNSNLKYFIFIANKYDYISFNCTLNARMNYENGMSLFASTPSRTLQSLAFTHSLRFRNCMLLIYYYRCIILKCNKMLGSLKCWRWREKKKNVVVLFRAFLCVGFSTVTIATIRTHIHR